MRRFRTAWMAVMAALFAAPAMAADLGPATLPVAATAAASEAAPAIEWGGWYVGTYTATTIPLPSSVSGVLGGVVGFDYLRGRFLAGAALSAHVGFGSFNRRDILLLGRLGGLVTDRLLLYARAGVGAGDHLVPSSWAYFYRSIGAEFALSETWSIFTEAGRIRGVGSTFTDRVVVGGLLWHFGR